MKEIDTKVLIVGGGPAGSSVGLCLIKEKIDCIIVDKAEFPREKLCGGLITETGMKELHFLGVDTEDEVFYRPSKIRFIKGEKAIFEYESNAEYAVVNRCEFDALLLEKYVKQGGKTILNDRVAEIDLLQKVAITNSGTRIHYEYLIGADGANSVVRKVLNKENIRLAFCSEVHVDKIDIENYPSDGINVLFQKIKTGFAWVFEGREKTTIGVGGIEKDNKRIIEILSGIYSPSKGVKGAFVPYGEVPKVCASDSVFLVGDAGGYVDPILGEGISYALLAGRKIAAVMRSDNKKSAYDKEFEELQKMVKYGKSLQKFFFNRMINRFAMRAFEKHRNLTIRLCEGIVMKGNIKYFERKKILGVIFHGTVSE